MNNHERALQRLETTYHAGGISHSDYCARKLELEAKSTKYKISKGELTNADLFPIIEETLDGYLQTEEFQQRQNEYFNQFVDVRDIAIDSSSPTVSTRGHRAIQYYVDDLAWIDPQQVNEAVEPFISNHNDNVDAFRYWTSTPNTFNQEYTVRWEDNNE